MRMATLSAAFVALAYTALPAQSAGAQQVGNTETICALKSGPRAGERMRLRGSSASLPIGSPCGDGEGSTGVVVAKDAISDGPGSNATRTVHRTCLIDYGPRAGQRVSGVTPARLGAPCRLRDGSTGVIVEDPPRPTRENPPLGGIPVTPGRPNPQVRPPANAPRTTPVRMSHKCCG